MSDILILNRDLLILYRNQINIVLFQICFLINDENRKLYIVKSNKSSRKIFLLFKDNVSNLIYSPKLTFSKNVAVPVTKTILTVGS